MRQFLAQVHWFGKKNNYKKYQGMKWTPVHKNFVFQMN